MTFLLPLGGLFHRAHGGNFRQPNGIATNFQRSVVHEKGAGVVSARAVSFADAEAREDSPEQVV